VLLRITTGLKHHPLSRSGAQRWRKKEEEFGGNLEGEKSPARGHLIRFLKMGANGSVLNDATGRAGEGQQSTCIKNPSGKLS